MFELNTTKNDEYYKLFHCLELDTNSKYMDIINKIILNLLKKEQNIYLHN